MPEQRFKVGSVQGLIMIMANFDREHGIAEPPSFLVGFKEWCESTNTDPAKTKDTRTKLNRISQDTQQPSWFIEAQGYYSEALDHGRNELILSVDQPESAPQAPAVDTGNDETLSMPVGGVEGGEPSASNKSDEQDEQQEEDAPKEEQGGEEEQAEEDQQEESAFHEEIEDVTKVDIVPDSKTFAELDAEKGVEEPDHPDAPEIPGPNDGD